ncbi:hypothetical protein [Tistlia consotensis]|nr:hypothetical protein [Tistlia consotensis]
MSANFSDATDTVSGGSSANSLAGVAIVGNAATSAQGAWQYSTDSGAHWSDVGTRSTSSALVLSGSTLVRFVPAADWNGTPGSLSVNLIDSSSGAVTNASTVDLSGSGATGGTTVYSAATVAIGTSVTAVNDAPTATGTATLTAVSEDTTSPGGGTVSALLSSTFGDATDQVTGGSSANGFAGVAIVGNAATSTQGVWQYSTDGTTWSDVGTRADGNALVLSTTDQLRFLPASDWNGTAGSLSFRTIDDSAGAVTGGTTANLTGATGGTTAVSAATATLATSVTAVNDAPTASGTATLTAVSEDTTSPGGGTVSALLSSTFGDATDQVTGGSSANGFAGVAIVGNAATSTQGVWQYSTDGTTWSDVGTRADGNALVLSTTDQLRFLPASDWNGTAGSLSFRTIDDSAGSVTGGSTADLTGATGGTTAVSAATATLGTSVTAVNDAPTATGDAALTVAEDNSGSAGSTVTALFGGKFSDATDAVTGGSSADSFAGVAIVGNAATTAQGVWQYSTDGTTWTDVGTRADGNALVLKASDSIRFLPAANFNGTVGSLTYRTIDSSSGAVTTGTQDLSSSTGGTTAFSANTKALTGSVTAVNDAPVASGSATLAAISEGDTNPAGDTVGSLVSANFDDSTDTVTGGSSAHSLAGLAIVGYAPNGSEGAWQYSTDGGTTWTAVGTRTAGTALLLDASARLRFLPDPAYHGTPAGLSVKVIDSSSGAVTSGTVSDLSGGGATGGTTAVSGASFVLGTSVGAVNDAPVNSVPAAQTVAEDGSLVFSTANLNALSMADIDLAEAGGPTNQATTTLSVLHGTLTVTASGSGVATVTGNGGGTVTLRGTQAEINAALQGLTYRPSDDYFGSDSLTISTNDEGNSGTGGAKADSDSVAITVTPLADQPTLSVSPASGNEDTAIPLSVTAGFLDTGSGSQQVVIDGIPAGSVLGTSTGSISVPGGGSVTLTPAQLSGLTITPPADSDTDFSLTVTARSTVGGVTLERQATLEVQVAAVADVPVSLTTPSPITVAQGGSASATIAASLTDVDGSESLSYRLSNIPSGMSFTNGAGQSFTPSGGTLLLTRAQAQGLTVQAGTASAGSYTIGMTAISSEARGGSTAQASSSFEVTVTASTTTTGGTGTSSGPTVTPPRPAPPAPPAPTTRGFPTGSPSIPAPANLTVSEAAGGESQGNELGGSGLFSNGNSLLGGGGFFGNGSSLLGGAEGGQGNNLVLTLAGSVNDQVLLTTVTRQFEVPAGTFRSSDPQARLSYEAKQSSGDALPNWLTFDAKTLTFKGTPPNGTEGTLEIALTARDERGDSATATFRVVVTKGNNQNGEPPPPQNPVAGTGNGTQQGVLPGEVPPQGERPQQQGALPSGSLRFGDQSDLAAAELGLLPIRWLPADHEADALLAQAHLPVEPPAGRAGFTMPLHDAGRGGLYAEARALLESLKRAAEAELGDAAPGEA